MPKYKNQQYRDLGKTLFPSRTVIMTRGILSIYSKEDFHIIIEADYFL